MRSLESERQVARRIVRRWNLLVVGFFGLCNCLTGCGDGIQRPSAQQLIAFESAGPSGPTVDWDRLSQARLESGPYRVVPGDVLQVEISQERYRALGIVKGSEVFLTPKEMRIFFDDGRAPNRTQSVSEGPDQ